MRYAGHSITFKSPISKVTDNLVGFAFVDDTDLVEGDLTSTDLTYSDIHKKMQEGINRWEGGLKTTGGAIRPDKSFVYPIDFTWDERRDYTYCHPDNINLPLTVCDENNIRHTLQQIPPNKGLETLGVFIAPDGSQNDQIQEMKRKASEWSEKLLKGHLPPEEAWHCMSTTIMKTLQYPLPALTLTKKNAVRF